MAIHFMEKRKKLPELSLYKFLDNKMHSLFYYILLKLFY